MSDYRWQQEKDEQEFMFRLELCQRIARGLTTEDDALYVASKLGIDFDERNHERTEETARV